MKDILVNYNTVLIKATNCLCIQIFTVYKYARRFSKNTKSEVKFPFRDELLSTDVRNSHVKIACSFENDRSLKCDIIDGMNLLTLLQMKVH